LGVDPDYVANLLAKYTRELLIERPRVPLMEKVYLTLDEAKQLAGLPKASLIRRIKDGTLKAVKDAEWRIRRTDLQSL